MRSLKNALGYLAVCAIGLIVLGVVLAAPALIAWAMNFWWVILGVLFLLCILIAFLWVMALLPFVLWEERTAKRTAPSA
jgi:protein-S-isoprenylcysteine O-methyltransferase Ste14